MGDEDEIYEELDFKIPHKKIGVTLEVVNELQGTLEDIKREVREWYWQADKQELAKDPCVVDSMVDLFIRTIDKHLSKKDTEEKHYTAEEVQRFADKVVAEKEKREREAAKTPRGWIDADVLTKRCMNGIDNEFLPIINEMPMIDTIDIDIFEMCKYRELAHTNDTFEYTCRCPQIVPAGHSWTDCSIEKCPFIHERK